MTPRRCFDCGARAADGADVRECDGCTFGVCEAHGDEGGKRRCEECKRIDEKEAAMSEKMPESMTEEAVAEWLNALLECDDVMPSAEKRAARAVLALVEAKVREGAIASYRYCGREAYIVEVNAIVARVMGTEAKRGPEAESREESPHA